MCTCQRVALAGCIARPMCPLDPWSTRMSDQPYRQYLLTDRRTFVNDGRSETGREAEHDFVHVHEFVSGFMAFTKRTRVRVFEGDGLPVVVLSSPEDPSECTVPDVELIAAEVMLRLYPKRALLASPRTPWFELIEHLPKCYDRAHWPISEHRWRDNLCEVRQLSHHDRGMAAGAQAS